MQCFERPLSRNLPAVDEWRLVVYSVEKLISQAHVILQANAKAAETPQ